MVNAYFRRVVVVEWDQIQKEASMSRLKKVMGLVLAGTLSLGIAVSAYAAESAMKLPNHLHAYSVVSYTCYNSYRTGQHKYLVGYRVDISGSSIPVYSTCDVVSYFYRGLWECACGATDGYDYKTETRHTSCGK